jgi:hypothetical protein
LATVSKSPSIRDGTLVPVAYFSIVGSSLIRYLVSSKLEEEMAYVKKLFNSDANASLTVSISCEKRGGSLAS